MSTTLYHNIVNLPSYWATAKYLSISADASGSAKSWEYNRRNMRKRNYSERPYILKKRSLPHSSWFLRTHYFGVLRPNRLCSSQYIIILIWDKKEFLLGIYIIGKHHTKWRQSHKHSAGLDKHYYRYAFHFMSKSKKKDLTQIEK